MTFFSNIWRLITQYGDVFFITGVTHTLLLAVITVGFGVIIGLILYFARKSRFGVVRGIGTAIVSVIRGTPMLLQLYVGYFLVPKMLPFFNPTPFISVAIALIPGASLYYAVDGLLERDLEAAAYNGNNSLTIALAISMGIVLVTLVNKFQLEHKSGKK